MRGDRIKDHSAFSFFIDPSARQAVLVATGSFRVKFVHVWVFHR